MRDVIAGGCQCSRVRYVAELESDDAYLCHCRMCQRATGGVSIAFVNVPLDRMTWEREPDWYRSSPIARRAFCSACGTPLGFAFVDDAATIDLTVGSFDDPSRFRPTQHFGTESLREAWIDTRNLPRTQTNQNAGIVKRWAAATGRLPE